jgi:hypothetical protein
MAKTKPNKIRSITEQETSEATGKHPIPYQGPQARKDLLRQNQRKMVTRELKLENRRSLSGDKLVKI